MPSPARTAARRGWRRWSAATSSSSRWTTAATGIAITTSLPTFCTRTCWPSSPTTFADLHRRASAWYEQNGEPADAIRHALAAEDFERAADLVELAMPAMRRSRQEATVLGWLKALPDELVRVRPVLSVGYAGALLASGELEGVEARLRDAERWLDTTADIGERTPGPVGGDGRRGRRGISPSPGVDRPVPCRPRPWLWAMCPAP